MTIPIPPHPAALTVEWLTARLCPAGTKVSDFTVAPLAANQGFFGETIRLQLDYTNGDTNGEAGQGELPRSLIAKFSSSNEAMRLRSINSYEREVRFYQSLAPQLDLPTPHCYYADIDVTSGAHLLLLEDLAPMQSGDRVQGCTVMQAGRAVLEVAKLHAHWWGQTDVPHLAWLADGDTHPDVAALRQQYAAWWPAFHAAAGEHLPQDLAAPSANLGEKRAAIRRHIFGAAPRTLIHRDYQLGNLLFGTGVGEAGDRGEFAVIDWQFLSRGCGVWDVAYLLSENLQSADRRTVEMELLHRYHDALMMRGVEEYSFEQALFDYRVALLQRHTALVSTIAAMPFSAEQRTLHIETLLPRNLAAIVDHDAFALVDHL
jgi:hypothetical protein